MINTRTQQVMESMHMLKRLNITETLGLMPRSEFVTLNTISRLSKDQPDGKVCASDISSRLCISGPAVSRSLNRLEDKGLIIRTIGRNDRRNVYIELTEAGISELKIDMEKYTGFMEATLSHLSDDEMEQFTRLCKKIAESMKTEIEKTK
jgi:DNA-binding MarR family transcriptional regulator